MKRILFVILLVFIISGCTTKNNDHNHAKLNDEGSYVYGSKNGQPERYHVTNGLYYKVGAKDYLLLYKMQSDKIETSEYTCDGQAEFISEDDYLPDDYANNEKYTYYEGNKAYDFRGGCNINEFVLDKKNSKHNIIKFEILDLPNKDNLYINLQYMESHDKNNIIFFAYMHYTYINQWGNKNNGRDDIHLKCSLTDNICKVFN